MNKYTKKSENHFSTLDSNSTSTASKQAPIFEILQTYKNGTLGRQYVQLENEVDEDRIQSKRLGQAPASIILQRYKESIQGYTPEKNEDLMQDKFDTVQCEEIDKNALLQVKFDLTSNTEKKFYHEKETSIIQDYPIV